MATLDGYEWNDRMGRRHREVLVEHLGVRSFDLVTEAELRSWLMIGALPKEPNPDTLDEWISTPLFWTRARISKGTTVRVGRGNDCEVSVSLDLRVSRAHGELRFTDDALYFVDVGSRFGTYRKGARFLPHRAVRIDIGDVIDLGESFILVMPPPRIGARRRRRSDSE
jgi:pSer/pThr/pTyr-binding forkhead associated (FHA) protein